MDTKQQTRFVLGLCLPLWLATCTDDAQAEPLTAGDAMTWGARDEPEGEQPARTRRRNRRAQRRLLQKAERRRTREERRARSRREASSGLSEAPLERATTGPAHEAPAPDAASLAGDLPTPQKAAVTLTPWKQPSRAAADVAARSTIHDEQTDEASLHERAFARESPAHPHFFFEIGAGVGITHLSRGRAPDRLPAPETMDRVAERALNEHTGEIDVAHADRALREEGWDCDTATDDQGRLVAEDCGVAFRPGFAAEPIFDLAIGYHALPRLSVALTGVVQKKRGKGPMAGVLVGARAEYLLTRPVRSGLLLSALAGLGVGSIQAHPKGATHETPHATNTQVDGIGASLSLGARGGYRVHEHLAIALTPQFNLGLPNVLFDMGMTLGTEVAF